MIKKIGIVMYQTSKTKGQEVIAKSMVKEFNRIGQEAYLITGPFRDYKRVVPKKIYKEQDYVIKFYQNLPIIRVDGYISKWPSRRIMFYSFPYVLRKMVHRLKLDVIIVHSNNWKGPAEAAQMMIWNKEMQKLGGKSRPIIFCYMPHYNPPDPKRYKKLELSSRISWDKINIKNIFKQASLVFNVTPIEKEMMIKLGAQKKQCHLYPNGVPDLAFDGFKSSSGNYFRRRYNIPESKKIVSFMGTLESRKNPLNFVKVAEKLQHREDIFFVLAGWKADQYKDIKPYLRKLNNVKFIGPVFGRDKVRFLKASYLNLILTRMEIFGIAQLEFMYFGVPVITSGVDGHKWLIKNNYEGIHVNGPDDIDGAAKAIENLVDNPELRNKLGRNAKLKGRKYGRSKLISKLNKRLDKLVLKERIKYKEISRKSAE